MKWTPGGESQDVEDRRDESGGGGGFQFGGMHIGIGGAILLLILSFVFKTNFFALLSGGGSVSPGPAAVRKPDPARDAAEKPLVQFVSFVLEDTRKTCTELLPQQGGKPNRHAKLEFFRDSILSACRGATAAPGHCSWPGDVRCDNER